MFKDKGAWPQYIVAFLIIVVIIVVALTAYWQRAAIRAELGDLKLIPMPERFTELYFENPSSLPTQTVAGTPMSFLFGIHNAEGVTTAYPYVVYFQEPTGIVMDIQTGTISLAPDASTTIVSSYTFPASNITGKVVVYLTSLNQHIDFLLSKIN
jgi:hypothetical protein